MANETEPMNISPPMRSPARPITHLTIYSKSGHIVQKVPGGTKSIVLPKSVEMASIVVIDTDGTIVPFSFIPESELGFSLTDRRNGEKLEVMVVKNNQRITGKVLALTSDNIMLMHRDTIESIRHYDTVAVPIAADLTRPHLFVDRTLKPFTVSYLLTSIAWTCVGTALIDSEKAIMYLRLAANIANDTESDISANTTLVSGEVYQNRRSRATYTESAAPRALMLSSQNAVMKSEKVQKAMLEDFTKYEVGERVIHKEDVAELGTLVFPVVKLYIFHTNDDTVRFGYRFVPREFIPACSLNVYSINPDKSIGSYMGSDHIEESQKDDEVDIILGESTLLQCKSTITSTNIVVQTKEMAQQYKLPLDRFVEGFVHDEHDEKWHVITENLKVEITNHSNKVASLVLKHYVGNKLILSSGCIDFSKREHGYIEWYFQVPAQNGTQPRKETFSCQIVTAELFY